MAAEGLCDVLITRLEEKEKWESLVGRDFTCKLTNLRGSMIVVRNALSDLEEKQNTQPLVKRCLNKVRHALYDAEDLIDEIATLSLQHRRSTQGADSLDSFNGGMDARIEGMNVTFEGFTKVINVLGLKAKSDVPQPVLSPESPPTGLMSDSTLYGRDSERDLILDILQDGAAVSCIRVVAIVGVPGIGKTALAQWMLDDPKVDKTFDVKVWIYVHEVFDIFRITSSILDLLTVLRSEDTRAISDVDFDTPEFSDAYSDDCTTKLESIQRDLRQRMAGKRFLIVLDDVQDEKHGTSWDALRYSLHSASPGSIIVVTTHNKDVARRFHPNFTLELHELSDDDCWSLIRAHSSPDPHVPLDENLKHIGRRIAAKCRGLPLAAKALGGLLAGTSDMRKWEDVENSRIWHQASGQKRILPALLVSYNFLPPHLRRCFAYCSIFPKNYQFQKEKLVFLWMAEGFIDPATIDTGRTEDSFNNLVARSFFQESCSNKHYFVMHDLIHELAAYVMGEFALMLDANTSHVVSGRPRHFTYRQCHYRTTDRCAPIAHPDTSRTLRTFLLMKSSSSEKPLHTLPSEMLQSLVLSFCSLRVLSLSGYKITCIPPSIASLKQLRYLDFSSTLIEELPETMCSLYDLQTLILADCHNLISLPRNIGNLIQMRHLDIRGTHIEVWRSTMPPDIRELSTLQILADFDAVPSKIRELGSFVTLKGRLTIHQVGDIAEADATAARLIEKVHLDELVLKDPYYFNRSEQQKRICEELRPHSNLRRLTIVGYRWLTFPDWVGDAAFHKLEFLHLKNGNGCTTLPPLGQLPLLKHLTIETFHGLDTVGPEFYRVHHSSPTRSFPSLKILRFKSMWTWKTWITRTVGDNLFASLVELHVEHCENLRGNLPTELPSLKVLSIISCRELHGSLPRSPLLRELTIEHCPYLVLSDLDELTCLTSLSFCWIYENRSFVNVEAALPHLTSLRKLKLGCQSCDRFILDKFPEIQKHIQLQYLHLRGGNFQMLNYLAIIGTCHLQELDFAQEEVHPICTSLYELSIGSLQLSVFPQGRLRADNLTILRIRGCSMLSSLSNTLRHCFPSLQCLSISYCPLLESFAEDCLPLRLKTLHIKSCEDLRDMPSMSWCTSLQQLNIYDCPKLELFPASGLPPNLRKLKISRCRALRSLPNNIHSAVTYLELLHITECPEIESFPPGRFLQI